MGRIGVLYVVLDMDLGGLQRIVNLLIRRIDKKQFIPYLCCLDRGGLFYDQLGMDFGHSYILKRKPGPFDLELFVNLYKLLRSNKIDIIHSQNGCSFYAALAGKMARVKGIIHTDHGRLVPDRKVAKLEDRIASLMMDRVIGVSEKLTEYLASEVKISGKKLMTIVNGADTQRFVPWEADQRQEARKAFGLNNTDKILGTVCRLDPIKNLELLIGSMPAICKTVPECKVLIVGDGPAESQLRNYAQRLGLNNMVIFAGRSAEIENVLPIFDLYVNTSVSEGTSMTILEAMSCGLPVVASAVGGNSMLVDSSNGALFPAGNKEMFEQKVINLLSNGEILIELGKESRRKVETNFSFDRVVKEYEELYRSLYSHA
jgi:glycosyltransferase involved in cell wall biosynthesis